MPTAVPPVCVLFRERVLAHSTLVSCSPGCVFLVHRPFKPLACSALKQQMVRLIMRTKKLTSLLDSEVLLRDAHWVVQNSFGSAGMRISVDGSVDRGDVAFGSAVLHSGPNTVFQPEPENIKTLSELKEAVHPKLKLHHSLLTVFIGQL